MAKKILIADDALFMRSVLKKIMLKNGYEVAGEATNGKQAVEMYQTLKPDIVTLDIVMPVMDGLEALKAIKELDPSANVLMISAMGQELLRKEAMDKGARGFIEKPFKEEEVLKSLAF